MAATEEDELCRCCLRVSKAAAVSLFSRHYKSSVLFADMLRECCDLEAVQNDGMPSKICLKCSNKLSSAYKFRKMCIRFNRYLINKLHTSALETVKSEIDHRELDDDRTNIVLVDTPKQNIPDGEEDVKIFKDIKVEIDDVLDGSEDYKTDSHYPSPSLHFTDEEKDDIAIPMELQNTDHKNPLNDILQKSEHRKRKFKTAKKIKKDRDKTKTVKTGMEIKKLYGRKNNVCPLCNRDCKDSTQLKEHINWIHKGIKYYCKICKKFYTSERDHKRTNHGPGKQCEQCGLAFDTIVQHKIHMRSVHRTSNPQKCDICNAVFASKEGLIQHKNSIHGVTKFICQFCSKTFNRKDKLDQHLFTHTKEKPHECNMCNAMFGSNYELNRHKRRHTMERNMKCEHCSAVFKTKEDLRKHILRHEEGVKRFACAICGKRFRRIDHRNVHQTKVHKVEDAQSGAEKHLSS